MKTATKPTKLKKGLTVNVYQDPITCKDLEGAARLLSDNKMDSANSYHLEDGTVRTLSFWFVEFEDGTRRDRWISILDLVK